MALQSFLSILATLWLAIVYTGSGAYVLRIFKLDDRWNLVTKILVCFAVGFGICGNIIMVMGFTGHLSSFSITTVLCILSIPAFYILYVAGLKKQAMRMHSFLLTYWRISPVLSGLVLLMITGYWARSILPPTGFDGLMYHLSTVKLYLREGGFWDIFFNPQSDFPMFTQMHYMIGLALGNDIIAKGISFIILIAAAALVFELTRILMENKKGHLFSVIIFLTLPVIIANGANCDVDISQAVWTVLAVRLLYDYIRQGGIKHLFLISFIAGLSLQTKIFGVFTIPILVCLTLAYHRKEMFSIRILAQIGLITIIPSLMGGPWYLKSLAYNDTIFLTANLSLGDTAGDGFAFFGFLADLLRAIVTAPWDYSLFPSHHRGNTFGPIFLMVLPFLFLLKQKPPYITYLLSAGGLYLLQIILMDSLHAGSSIRYTISTQLLLVPPAVWSLVHVQKNFRAVSGTVVSLVLVIVIMHALVFVKRYNREWIAILTLKTRDAYLSSVLPEYSVIRTINALPDSSVIMPVYNFSEYLIEKKFITAYKRYESQEQMMKDLETLGINYIFGNNKLDIEENANPFPEIRNKKLVRAANGFSLFEIQW
ncbi:MAG: glycosyltransferase family 39 protein [Fibrobacterota bacterium]